MRTRLIIASGNPGKLVEMEKHLASLGLELSLKPTDLEVEETGETFAENACLKAAEVAKATGEWAIADDSGLAVDALNGAPGVYSARYGATDAERIQRLLAALGDTPQRSAQFIAVIALASPDGSIVAQAEGVCAGEILLAPQGGGGFGYDPIFYVPSVGMTFAEMPPEVKREISHRGRAFQTLIPQIRPLLTVP